MLAVTGGGTSVIADLFSVAGASGTILEACVPYHQDSLSAYLRSRETHSCSSATARAMAMVAYQRARAYSESPFISGVGCTAAIATDRDRRGADRCHVAIQKPQATMTFDLELDRSQTRDDQERLCNRLVSGAIAESMNLESGELPEPTSRKLAVAPESWRRLLADEIKRTGSAEYDLILSGSFNPLHDGHRAMIEVARRRIPGSLALEVSIENVDKPPLDFLTMRERQCEDYDMVFTRAATFAEKAGLFPGARFLIGIDTVVRINDPKYYDDDIAARDLAIRHIGENGNRFLVFGRLHHGVFRTLSDVALTEPLRRLCDEVSAEDFRLDINSTGLRSGGRP